jgi:hypothetical protein
VWEEDSNRSVEYISVLQVHERGQTQNEDRESKEATLRQASLKRQKYTTSQSEQEVTNVASRSVSRNINNEKVPFIVITTIVGSRQRPFSHTVRDLNMGNFGRRE